MPNLTRAAATQDDDGLRAFLTHMDQAVRTGDPAAFRRLLTVSSDPMRATQFAADEFGAGVTRTLLKERERHRLPDAGSGDGYRLIVDAFIEFGSRARVATWRLDVRKLDATEWGIEDEERLSSVEGLYHLSVNASKQFDARNFTIAAEDLELTLETGTVFTIDTDQGVTGLVLMGRGVMRFHPAPETEKRQVKMFAGAELLESRFDTAFIRVGNLASHADPSMLVARPVDAHDLKRAEQIFHDESVKSFGLDLADLTGDTWSLLPSDGDFLSEVRTQRFDALTYSRTTSEPEDVSLFDRRRQKTIALYASAEKLASRGRFYNEDDLATYDVLDYNIQVAVTPDRLWLDGRATLRLKMRSATRQLTLRLADSLVIESIVSDRFDRLLCLRVKNQNIVLVNLPAALRPDADLALTIAYHGTLSPQPPDQETLLVTQQPAQGATQPSLMDDLQARGIQEGLNETTALRRAEPTFLYSNRSYWYPQAVVSDYATATIRISVPAAFTCVASGEPAPDSPALVPGGNPSQARRLFTFDANRPIRYLSFAVSRFVPAERAVIAFDTTPDAKRASLARNAPDLAGENAALDLAVLTNPRQTARAHALAERSVDIAQFYQAIVGDSPYESLSVALFESALPGGHSPAYFALLGQSIAPTSVAPRDDPATFPGYPNFVLAHEIAHQWWGQAVGWRNYHEQWLSEGFAQYFAALYAQHERGDDTFRSLMRQMRSWGLDESDQGPVYLGYRVGHIRGDDRAFRAVIYDKGAAVLHMLRRLIGDDAFFRGLRRFYAASRFQKAGTDDLRLAMEAETDRPLDRFFERWVYGSTLPRLKFAYRVERSTAGQAIVLHFDQIGDLFDVPVTVTLQYADHKSIDVIVPVTERSVDKRITLDGTFRSAAISKDDGTLVDVHK